jgi:hypothetical protein
MLTAGLGRMMTWVARVAGAAGRRGIILTGGIAMRISWIARIVVWALWVC